MEKLLEEGFYVDEASGDIFWTNGNSVLGFNLKGGIEIHKISLNCEVVVESLQFKSCRKALIGEIRQFSSFFEGQIEELIKEIQERTHHVAKMESFWKSRINSAFGELEKKSKKS